MSEAFHLRAPSSDIKIKVRNASNPKLENLAESTKENLEFLINKLKSEKLEVFKEILNYEEKYNHKLCLKARLDEMKNLCTELLNMSKAASDRLHVENDLFAYLQIGTMSISEDKFCEESNSEEEENQETEEFIQTLIEISGVACICLSKITENGSVSLSIYPYCFTQAVGVDLDIKADLNSLENLLSKNVFPFLSFSMTDTLKLQIAEVNFGYFKFLATLKNLSSPIEIRISLKDSSICFETINCMICVVDSHLYCLFSWNKLLEASVYISQNLSMLMRNDERILAWQAKPWELEKHSLKKLSENHSLVDLEQQSVKFEEFYEFVFDADVIIDPFNCSFEKMLGLHVELWKNSISGCFKLILSKNNKKISIQEECYTEDFLFFQSLQDFDFSRHKKTMLNSLEFMVLLSKFISN